VAVAGRLVSGRPVRLLWGCALAMAVAEPVVFLLAQQVPLDELQLIWDLRQVFYLFAYYLLFFVPFFFAGCFVALAFTIQAGQAHRLYFYNMSGSGLAVAAVVWLMCGSSPESLLLVVSAAGFAAALVLAVGLSLRRVGITLVCAVVCLLVFSSNGPFPLSIRISENKSLVYYRALPDVEVVASRYSPLGRLDCVRAPTIRYFPGLELGYRGNLPSQMLIIRDGDGVSAVNHFERLGELDCLGHTTSALPYHLIPEPNVCVIGAGGGFDVGQALVCGAKNVTAVEMNQQVVELMRGELRDFACGLYERGDVEVAIAEGRSFLETTARRFDVITISLLDSFTASSAGVYALNESHLYTVEAVECALSRLGPGGVLSITRVLKTPARDVLKMLATVAEALRRRGVVEPASHVAAIRSWATATIVASPQPFEESQLEAARRFAEQHRFDLVHLPGLKEREANRFYVLERPVYYEAARHILSDNYRQFYCDYPYSIKPATDDRPYFFDFFKLRALPGLIRAVGGRWLVFSEWGYLVLAATLAQAVIASGVFILIPLFVAKQIRAVRTGKPAVVCYFLLLGLAYMFLEMGFIQRLTLLIGHPVFGVAVTLSSFLVFSGIGSLASGRLLVSSPVRRIVWAIVAVVLLGSAEIIVLRFGLARLFGFSLAGRIVLGVLLTAPLALFMGVPFPSAIKQISIQSKALVPWAWGVNGFASVTGAVLGTLLAISVGFTVLAVAALGCYLFAALLCRYVCRDPSPWGQARKE